MKKKAFKYGSLFIGLIAAVVIILSQSFLPDPSSINSAASTTASESNDTDRTSGADVSVQTISTTSFPASAQINFFQEASCLFEVIFDTRDSYSHFETIASPLSKFYSTILRVIISPNAP